MKILERISPIGLDRKPVERTKEEYPYSYDTFIVWQREDIDKITSIKTVYSDRLFEWDIIKYNRCSTIAFGDTSQYFNNRSKESIENFLNLYLGIQLELVAIAEGCNHCSGYPFWVFEYIEK